MFLLELLFFSLYCLFFTIIIVCCYIELWLGCSDRLFGLLECQQDYIKTTKQISTKLGLRMSLSSEQTRLTFGADPDKETHPGIVSHFCQVYKCL